MDIKPPLAGALYHNFYHKANECPQNLIKLDLVGEYALLESALEKNRKNLMPKLLTEVSTAGAEASTGFGAYAMQMLRVIGELFGFLGRKSG